MTRIIALVLALFAYQATAAVDIPVKNPSSGNIALPSVKLGSSSNALTYADSFETTMSFTDSGGWTKNGVRVAGIRINNMVYLSVEQLGTAASSSTNDIISATSVPTAFCPVNNDATFQTWVYNNSYIQGSITVQKTTCDIRFKAGNSNNGWSSGGVTKGLPYTTMAVYSVNN